MSLLNKKRISIKTKIFIMVGLFAILSIVINIFIVKLSINNIYVGLEKRELKKEYQLIKNNIYDENKLIDLIYEANNNGLKIKIYDADLNVIYSIFNDKLNNEFTKYDIMLLNSLENDETKIITLKSYEQNGYDLYLGGRTDNKYVLISSSIESLKKDAKTAIVVLLMTSFFSFLIFILLSYFISKFLSKKINEVKLVTEDISNLNFNKKIEITTNDELGDLFSNVNEMSSKLQNSIKSLESANKQLKKDLLEKEKQDKIRKQLIANISHEFKTPLTIISGYSQLLMGSLKSNEDKENIELILNETDKLSELVHEFLDLSRLESGNVVLNKEVINMEELISLEIKKLNVRIQDKKINLKTEFIGNQELNGDRKLISRVIENILTNAIKFTKGKKEIKIKSYILDNYYTYEVYNTGDNIKQEDLENIFNSYYKDKSARNKEGTGLGLTIVKAIVNLHEGICSCKNEKDGVTFIIKIKK